MWQLPSFIVSEFLLLLCCSLPSLILSFSLLIPLSLSSSFLISPHSPPLSPPLSPSLPTLPFCPIIICTTCTCCWMVYHEVLCCPCHLYLYSLACSLSDTIASLYTLHMFTINGFKESVHSVVLHQYHTHTHTHTHTHVHTHSYITCTLYVHVYMCGCLSIVTIIIN